MTAVRALDEAGLLDAAERCRGRHHIDAALALACVADPDLDAAAAPDLRLGLRDRLLLDMRAATFGSRIDLRALCPGCDEDIDVGITTDALRLDDGPAGTDPVQVRLEDGQFMVRAATSRDLAAVAHLADPEEARQILACRCIAPVGGAVDARAPAHLSEAGLEAVARCLGDLDPGADPFVVLVCPACRYDWQLPVDIGIVLVHDIEAAVQRLLDDVHDLARAYHWGEAEILALPVARRRAYLERIRS